jgi:hypothetical protein
MQSLLQVLEPQKLHLLCWRQPLLGLVPPFLALLKKQASTALVELDSHSCWSMTFLHMCEKSSKQARSWNQNWIIIAAVAWLFYTCVKRVTNRLDLQAGLLLFWIASTSALLEGAGFSLVPLSPSHYCHLDRVDSLSIVGGRAKCQEANQWCHHSCCMPVDVNMDTLHKKVLTLS